MKVLVCIAAVLTVASGAIPKRGGSWGKDNSTTCEDGAVVGIQDSWWYNWGATPDQQGLCKSGSRFAAEFVPMIWGCWGNCSHSLPSDYVDIWQGVNAQFLLGFNEPDNSGQANLTPLQAAKYWPQVQAVAASANLTLVSPALTHWSVNGSAWLDQFLGNCSIVPGCDVSLIKYIAVHDYSGDATGIVQRAQAFQQLYNRQIWLTEFSVGNGAGRAANDAFCSKVLPGLEASPSVYRYAWYSSRNPPASWVNASSLLDVSSSMPVLTSTGVIYAAKS